MPLEPGWLARLDGSAGRMRVSRVSEGSRADARTSEPRASQTGLAAARPCRYPIFYPFSRARASDLRARRTREVILLGAEAPRRALTQARGRFLSPGPRSGARARARAP